MHPESELIAFVRGDLPPADRARVAAPRRGWWRRPVPTVLAAGFATILIVFAMHGVPRTPSDVVAMEETVLGARLPLLQQYQIVERLDMLEDLDAIRQLDRLGGAR